MKTGNYMMIGIGVLCVGFMILAAVFFVTGSAKDMFIAISVMNALLILLFAGYLVMRWLDSRKTGLPLEDEMSHKIKFKAGYYSWLIAMYLMVGMMLVQIAAAEIWSYTISIDRMLPYLVIVPGLAFVALSLLYRKKGISE